MLSMDYSITIMLFWKTITLFWHFYNRFQLDIFSDNWKKKLKNCSTPTRTKYTLRNKSWNVCAPLTHEGRRLIGGVGGFVLRVACGGATCRRLREPDSAAAACSRLSAVASRSRRDAASRLRRGSVTIALTLRGSVAWVRHVSGASSNSSLPVVELATDGE